MDNVVLATGSVYHIFNKSIAGFKIFNNDSEFLRMQRVIRYYRIENPRLRFSRYISNMNREGYKNFNDTLEADLLNQEKLINIIAYCIMDTHIHLILKQLKDNGISIFMSNVLNSYTRYFNTKYKRKGPLWEARFKRVLVKTNEQLLYLTRYVHLNPVTAYIVNKPGEWAFSSYNEYVSGGDDKGEICEYGDILDINSEVYREFVGEYIDYQRNLAKIKTLILDQNSTS